MRRKVVMFLGNVRWVLGNYEQQGGHRTSTSTGPLARDDVICCGS